MNDKALILAIDDAPVNLKTLVAALSDDYDLQVATSGEEGLAQAAATPPNLILLDVMMPGMDGYEVCRRLKADPRLREIPVIFISAMIESEAEASGLDLGAVDYLTKPINVPIAQRRIHNHLEREALRQQITRHRDLLEEQVRERTLALSIAKEAAEGANHLKTTILTNLNHEFRTPMNGVLGMLSLLKRKLSEPKQLDYVNTAERSANRLLGVLTGLLDLALVESNRITLERRTFVVPELTATAIRQMESEAHSKGLSIDYEPQQAPEMPAAVSGDAPRIGQILQELVSNAIKFSSAGTITVRSSLDKADAGRLILGYEVIDQGIGIASADLPYIFRAFHQVDGTSTRHFGGNGIGLALCKQLVHHMGGEIKVHSEPGQGSRFAFFIPVEPAKEKLTDTQPQPVDLSLNRHAGASVLVAEDNYLIQTLIKASLEPAGFDVCLACDGEQALSLAQEHPFDLVLMDLMMPNMSGLDAARALRQMPGYALTPIIALTAKAYESDRDAFMREGMNGYIVKPFNNDLLLDQVLAALD